MILDTNKTFVKKAYWDCSAESGNCYGCVFRNISGGLDNCLDYRGDIKIVFTKTIPEFKPIPIQTSTISDENLMYLGIGIALVLVTVILILAVIIHRKKDKIQDKMSTTWSNFRLDLQGRLKSSQKTMQEWLGHHFGIRFKHWKKQESKVIVDDVSQNVMLLANGILAIVFAIEWNSDNNPLLVSLP